jgi:hypothetical protein
VLVLALSEGTSGPADSIGYALRRATSRMSTKMTNSRPAGQPRVNLLGCSGNGYVFGRTTDGTKGIERRLNQYRRRQ